MLVQKSFIPQFVQFIFRFSEKIFNLAFGFKDFQSVKLNYRLFLESSQNILNIVECKRPILAVIHRHNGK